MSATDQDNVIEKEAVRENIKPPKLYNVVLINDDYTPFDFVIDSLQSIFNRTSEDAQRIAAKVDKEGDAIANEKPYPRDIADQKALKLGINAGKQGYPFISRVEPAP